MITSHIAFWCILFLHYTLIGISSSSAPRFNNAFGASSTSERLRRIPVDFVAKYRIVASNCATCVRFWTLGPGMSRALCPTPEYCHSVSVRLFSGLQLVMNSIRA